MPKDWATYKAEVRQLYIEDGRTLEEVREVLKARHGFTASIRAYRMKVDQWEFRKYKMKKLPLHQPTRLKGSPPSPSFYSENSISDSLLPNAQVNSIVCRNASPPSGFMSDSRIHSLADDPLESAGHDKIVDLLRNWRSGGDYLHALANTIHEDQPQDVLRIVCGRPFVFELIEEMVSPEEQYRVGKILLDYDLNRHRIPEPTDYEWLVDWHSACEAHSWDEAKIPLHDNGSIICTAGKLFLDCAQIVIAERLLRSLWMRLSLLEPSSAQELPNDIEAEKYGHSYLDIVAEFDHSELNLHSSFYKQAVELLEQTHETANDQRSTIRSDLANDYRQKCLQLECLEGEDMALDAHESHLQRAREISEGSLTPNVSSKSDDASPKTCRSSTLENRADSITDEVVAHGHLTVDTTGLVNILLSKWRSFKGFRRYALEILEKDGSETSIFEGSATAKNLFDMILGHVQQCDIMPFTKSILAAFSSASLDPVHLPSETFLWWTSLYNSTAWPEFLVGLEEKTIDSFLKDVMSPAAVRHVINATVLLVGERFLLDLNTKIAHLHSRNDTFDCIPNYQLSQQYMAILKEFQVRNLGVDLRWLSLALNH